MALRSHYFFQLKLFWKFIYLFIVKALERSGSLQSCIFFFFFFPPPTLISSPLYNYSTILSIEIHYSTTSDYWLFLEEPM